MLDVLQGLGLVEGAEVKTRNHPLGELFEFGLAQDGAQLGLTDQDDLQQLALTGLQVGQQAQLLQHIGREVLRLVDDEHIALAPGVAGQQVGVERIEVVLDGRRANALVLHLNVKFAADRLEQVADGQLGVEDVGDPAVLGQLFEEATAHRGLASADFATEQHKTTAAPNAVEQMRQRLPMALAHEEVARVRCNGKRALFEPEKLGVHAPEHTAAFQARQRRWAGCRTLSALRSVRVCAQAARAMACLLILLQ